MKIGIIGSGKIGGAIGTHWAQYGHQVMFSNSQISYKLKDLAQQAGENAQAGTIAEAAEFGDVILFAPPYWKTDEALNAADSLDSKILIDATNPYRPDFTPEPPSIIGALELAKKAPGARIVKAYNMIRAEVLANEAYQSDRFAVYYCGDDQPAKEIVAQLIVDSGFIGVDAGSLRDAAKLEPHGALYDQKLNLETAQQLLASV
jgi:predicted dinucleotide-binding enzyme